MPTRDELREALKRAASALKAEGVPFALGGGYALWVHGAPESAHDVDLVVPEPRADEAADVLAKAGFAVERTPEDWLFKAHLNAAFVDVLHQLCGEPVDDALVATAEDHEVIGMRIPVLDAQQVMSTKLRSMTEHYCDFAALLPLVRAVREQLDWPALRAEVEDNDFAAAFLFLTDRLGLTDRQT